MHGGQGAATKDYAVLKISDLSHVYSSGHLTTTLYDGSTSASDGAAVYSTGNITYGAITGAVVKIQHLTSAGLGTEQTITFPEDVEWAQVHFEGNQWIVTAIDVTTRTKLYYHYGLTGTASASNFITLTYPMETSPIRDLRHVRGDLYLLAYLGTVGGTTKTYILTEISI
jgi:hypothetical protein